VWQDNVILAQSYELMERGQDARLMPLVQATMARARKSFSDLDRIAVSRGPGSFTGSRVGLAAARGIGLASGKPVFGIDRFSIYEEAYKAHRRDLLVVIQSKRTELFCQFIPLSGLRSEPAFMDEETIQKFLAAHPDTMRVGDGDKEGESESSLCATLAAHKDRGEANVSARPLYLRAPDVSFAAAKSR
jgi:tRNA threonylcarbamoyladenosine biosynthesis protein TsaB